MRDALARHDELLRDAIEGHGGYMVKTTGDGFHAAFSAADAGVSAAIAAQRALDAAAWGGSTPGAVLRVANELVGDERMLPPLWLGYAARWRMRLRTPDLRCNTYWNRWNNGH
jgi:hypothetical protein